MKPALHVNASLWESLGDEDKQLLKECVECFLRQASGEDLPHISTTVDGHSKVENIYGTLIVFTSDNALFIEDFIASNALQGVPASIWALADY